MRRVNQLATLSRAFSGAASSHQRLVQGAAMISTYAASNSQCFASRIAESFGVSNPSVARGVTGTVFFSVAASSLAQEAQAKEAPPVEKLMPKDVVLYQYEACPFCNKVKAFLDYYNIPYKVVEVNPINKKEIKWSDYKKVPILKIDGEQMVDSSDIVDKLFQRIHPDNSVTESDEERQWRGWVDNHLVHVLSPNIYRSVSEALESFDYITTHGNFSFTERLVAKYAGATAMYFVSKKLKKRHNITDERAALYGAAETWVDALKGRQYLGGLKPNLADLAVFGVLRPIRYLKSGKDMVEHTRIGEWYSRVENAVGEPSRIKA
ncbi:prostaglandin E synthase 2 [Populus alba x Populus x berolinensis]|uniref:Prostaglandin E synthase 2 n=2 Tax=Populus alba x Populus x berolinensis TaxID=444605 RepID=A0AAD6QYR7_9ROSI|nr:prostaglandin E synthase 2 [Populus alba x Populus x berolinensis]KAJ6999188.1 prostaglandin E synthase 2 [Populus alba x Populus x berolinensis]